MTQHTGTHRQILKGHPFLGNSWFGRWGQMVICTRIVLQRTQDTKREENRETSVQFSSVQFSCLVVSDCDHPIAAHQASLSITNSRRLLKLMCIESERPWCWEGLGTGRPAAAAAAKSLQSCPTLCNPIDGNPPGSSVPGILQARTLEWVAISFSNTWKWKVKVKLLSPVRLLATSGTAAHQAPPSMGFSRQEYWSGVPLPPPTGRPR